jgi:hypothetical protein
MIYLQTLSALNFETKPEEGWTFLRGVETHAADLHDISSRLDSDPPHRPSTSSTLGEHQREVGETRAQLPIRLKRRQLFHRSLQPHVERLES